MVLSQFSVAAQHAKSMGALTRTGAQSRDRHLPRGAGEAPMPKARVTMATTAKLRLFQRVRTPKATSLQSVSNMSKSPSHLDDRAWYRFGMAHLNTKLSAYRWPAHGPASCSFPLHQLEETKSVPGKFPEERLLHLECKA